MPAHGETYSLAQTDAAVHDAAHSSHARPSKVAELQDGHGSEHSLLSSSAKAFAGDIASMQAQPHADVGSDRLQVPSHKAVAAHVAAPEGTPPSQRSAMMQSVMALQSLPAALRQA